MTVWTLKCVGYDNGFQLQLSEKFSHWVRPPKKEKKASASQKPTHRTGKPRGEKRKRAETPESDVQKTDESEDEEVDEEVKILAYNAKGTRSRPIRL